MYSINGGIFIGTSSKDTTTHSGRVGQKNEIKIKYLAGHGSFETDFLLPVRLSTAKKGFSPRKIERKKD